MPLATDAGRMRFGVEAEFALADPDGTLRDFATLPYRQAASIVERLGDGDPPDLVRGDLGIKSGRWYVEGDERFDERGRLLACVPKGIETRTRPLVGIPDTVAALDAQTAALAAAAARDGLLLASIGWNPVPVGVPPGAAVQPVGARDAAPARRVPGPGRLDALLRPRPQPVLIGLGRRGGRRRPAAC